MQFMTFIIRYVCKVMSNFFTYSPRLSKVFWLIFFSTRTSTNSENFIWRYIIFRNYFFSYYHNRIPPFGFSCFVAWRTTIVLYRNSRPRISSFSCAACSWKPGGLPSSELMFRWNSADNLENRPLFHFVVASAVFLSISRSCRHLGWDYEKDAIFEFPNRDPCSFSNSFRDRIIVSRITVFLLRFSLGVLS